MLTWSRHHLHSLQLTLRRFVAAPLATLANISVIGVVLSLPLGGHTLLVNLQSYAGAVPAEPQISLFLAPGAARGDIQALEARLRAIQGVRTIRHVSPDAALSSLKRIPGLADTIASLRENPLPDSFVLMLENSDPKLTDTLVSQLTTLPGVVSVQSDSAWVQRIDALVRLAKTAVIILALLLGFALVAVTFNTIRLHILTQREEIEVGKLVGATDAYIRRPFYYQGLMMGLGGGAIALLIVYSATMAFNRDLSMVGPIFGVLPILHPLPAADALSFLGFAALLGWLGTHLSVSRHLLATSTRG